jgi:hypothetical protein
MIVCRGRRGAYNDGVGRIVRILEIALLGLGAVWIGDYLSARYRIPGNRQMLGTVQVRTLYAVRLKGKRIEYSIGDKEDETCVRSIFPQLGFTPCWYLTRHATRRVEIGGGRLLVPQRLDGVDIAGLPRRKPAGGGRY